MAPTQEHVQGTHLDIDHTSTRGDRDQHRKIQYARSNLKHDVNSGRENIAIYIRFFHAIRAVRTILKDPRIGQAQKLPDEFVVN